MLNIETMTIKSAPNVMVRPYLKPKQRKKLMDKNHEILRLHYGAGQINLYANTKEPRQGLSRGTLSGNAITVNRAKKAKRKYAPILTTNSPRRRSLHIKRALVSAFRYSGFIAIAALVLINII